MWIGGKRYRAVKDTGAASTTIPEHIAMDIVNRARNQDPALPDYPVTELIEYTGPRLRLQGFAGGEPVEVRHGCVFNTEFRGEGKVAPAFLNIEYRVVPSEADTGGSILLGAGTVGPEGLDIRTTALHHIVTTLGIRCPRVELLSEGRCGGAGSPGRDWRGPAVRG